MMVVRRQPSAQRLDKGRLADAGRTRQPDAHGVAAERQECIDQCGGRGFILRALRFNQRYRLGEGAPVAAADFAHQCRRRRRFGCRSGHE